MKAVECLNIDWRSGNMVDVPNEFTPTERSKYPDDNFVPFEEYFHNYFSDETIRMYLPIMWTAYYRNNHDGKDAVTFNKLQAFLNSLDTSKKYFTIVQYDDGIHHNVSHLDLLVFSMSGFKDSYPLPLICQPHVYAWPHVKKDIFCSFVGSITHPIRKKMLEVLGNNQKYVLNTLRHSIQNYCMILQRSTFVLCPRGYGMNSFRIQESLQYRAIPVYISDKFIYPHNVDFNEYGVVIRERDMKNLDKILSSITHSEIEAKRKRGVEIYKEYYTFEKNREIILNLVK